jgi:mono/diheme cytochrome c family protein
MRIPFAKLLVVVTGLLIVMLAIIFALIRNPSDDAQVAAPNQVAQTTPEAGVVAPRTSDANSRAPQAATVARGRAVYFGQRCRVCHSIEGEGNTRLPLDGVSARLTEKEIRLWIVAPQEMNPAVAKRGYQLSEEDLNALVAYLIANTHQRPCTGDAAVMVATASTQPQWRRQSAVMRQRSQL